MSQKQIRAVRDEEPPILALDPKKPKPQGKIRPLGPRKPDSKNGKHCPSSDDDSFTEVLHIHMTQPADIIPDDKRTTRFRGENKLIKFKIDTGAHCNTLILSDNQKIQHEGELKR
ncbi:unnamed protein product [Pocillopora meandrina]|uniref:Uncharacterized protein n=1 Tax=Pocillopora meandrina TaxID=46732 RepID=A0AAU9X3Y8_9CNID|nr:unnamed protein product [Pocillopora meandrina]